MRHAIDILFTHPVLKLASVLAIAGCVLLAIPVTANAQEPSEGDIDQTEQVFVTPPSEPTEVRIGLYLIGIDSISPPSEALPTFEVEMFMDLQWVDERLAFDPDEVGAEREVFEEHNAELELDLIWWPDIEIENEQHERITENLELVIYPDGTVEYEERFSAVVHAEFDLIKFPFDTQALELDLESFAWDDRYVMLVPNENRIGYNEDFSLPEWEITGIDFEASIEQEIRSDEKFSELIYTIYTERLPGFYIWKFVVPFFIIIVWSWFTFWMEGESIGSRISQSFFVLLSVVAFHQVISGFLPNLSYLTLADAAVIVAYLFMSLAIVENLIVHWLRKSDREADGDKLDRLSRFLAPVSFVVVYALLLLIYL